ncbi:hypothetical protein MKW92_050180 [Papaver armeniacum]|nr:hypothetical protein MKW92_050180 [Papaver armeniacum]
MKVITQIKTDKDLEMHPPPGKEDANNANEDKNSDSSNSAAQVAEDEDNYEQEPEPVVLEVFPDPDFYDFDGDKSEECFAADQIWAMYCYTEVMPRYYARIDKVFTFQGGYHMVGVRCWGYK